MKQFHKGIHQFQSVFNHFYRFVRMIFPGDARYDDSHLFLHKAFNHFLEYIGNACVKP